MELVSVPAATRCFEPAQGSVLWLFRSFSLFLPFLATLGFLLGALWRFRCPTCSAVTGAVGAELDTVFWEGEVVL